MCVCVCVCNRRKTRLTMKVRLVIKDRNNILGEVRKNQERERRTCRDGVAVGSNRIVCSLEIFSDDRQREEKQSTERILRTSVFVLINSRQEMRLPIEEEPSCACLLRKK